MAGWMDGWMGWISLGKTFVIELRVEPIKKPLSQKSTENGQFPPFIHTVKRPMAELINDSIQIYHNFNLYPFQSVLKDRSDPNSH